MARLQSVARHRSSRALLGGVLVAVVASSVWGARGLGDSLSDAHRKAKARAALDAVDSGVAREREVVRAGGRRADVRGALFFRTARTTRVALELAHDLASPAASGRLLTLHESSTALADSLFLHDPTAVERRNLQRSLDRTLAALARETAETRVEVGLREPASWPATAGDRAAAASMAILFAVGMGVALAGIVRLAGWGRREDLRRLELARLEREALTDNLTGLRNHRAFQEDLNREIERRNRTGEGFSLLMVDLNGLKEINDTAGHQVGDKKIKAVAECLKESVRGSDCAYRVGGDEFVVLLAGERAWGGLTFGQRLHVGTTKRKVSVTIGVAESTGTEGRDSLIRHADIALYEAKRSHLGTVVYNPGLEPQPEPSGRGERRGHQKVLATALARAVDAKDAATRNHCETVAEICALIARELGLGPERIERVRIAGLLHDVGKIGIADAILQKPAQLGREERAIMSAHPSIGHDIVSATDLEEEAAWVLHHHERWDGAGYPQGLAAEDIPLESRIILVADAFEALISDRPYRSRRTPEAALEEIVRNAGTQFDPDCVAALCAVFAHEPSVRLDELSARRRARDLARDEVSSAG